MTSVTERKRQDLLGFIDKVLKPEPAVQGVVAIGSLASGHAQPDSDIDAIIFLDPMDWYIVPAEFIWNPEDGRFYSIFSENETLKEVGIGLDFRRIHLAHWRDPNFEWPEGLLAELATSWLAFDRSGEIERLIASRTAYPESIRLQRLDEAVVWLDQHLFFSDPVRRWHALGPTIAHDRLQAAYHYLVEGLFAYNRSWRPWRNRQMISLLRLKWLPEEFSERVLEAANPPSLDVSGYTARVETLRSLSQDFLAELTAAGLYSSTPIDQAFIRSHDEPGYAWNMDDWNAENLRRVISTVAEAQD